MRTLRSLRSLRDLRDLRLSLREPPLGGTVIFTFSTVPGGYCARGLAGATPLDAGALEPPGAADIGLELNILLDAAAGADAAGAGAASSPTDSAPTDAAPAGAAPAGAAPTGAAPTGAPAAAAAPIPLDAPESAAPFLSFAAFSPAGGGAPFGGGGGAPFGGGGVPFGGGAPFGGGGGGGAPFGGGSVFVFVFDGILLYSKE